MAITLVEAAKLSNDVLLQGIIETIITNSDLLAKLPFIDIVGNGLTYNRESTLPNADFYAPGDTWNESTPTFSQATAVLTIIGGDADVDEFIKKTRSNIQDVKAAIIELKAKAVARKFDWCSIYGSTSTNAKQFDGMHVLVPTANKVHQGSGSTGAAGTIAKLRQMIRCIKPGKPDFLMMNTTMRDGLSAYAERNYSPIRYAGVGEFGKRVMTFDDIPILINDWITQTETISGSAFSAETGGTTTSIFAGKFGEKALCGCQNGGVERKDLGDLETKDASRTRIKWYCSMALFSTLALAVMDGITNTPWTA